MRPRKPRQPLAYAVIIGGFVLALCYACAHQPKAAKASVEPAGPVVVRIVSRDSTITAHASSNGPVYSMQDKSGQTVVPAMSLQTLQAQHPDIARRVQVMSAIDTSGAWAGIEN